MSYTKMSPFCAFFFQLKRRLNAEKVLRAVSLPSRSEFFRLPLRTLLHRSSAKELNFRFWSKKSLFQEEKKTIQNGIIIITKRKNIIIYILLSEKIVPKRVCNREFPK